VTALGGPGLVVYLFCVSGSGSSEVAGDFLRILDPMLSQATMYPGVIHVMLALFCHVLGHFGKMICQRLTLT
jgi:hypothetical protein